MTPEQQKSVDQARARLQGKEPAIVLTSPRGNDVTLAPESPKIPDLIQKGWKPKQAQAQQAQPQQPARQEMSSGQPGWQQTISDIVDPGPLLRSMPGGGFLDEMSAGIATGGGLWGDYEDALKFARQRDQTSDLRNPTMNTVKQIGGALFPLGVGARLAGPMVSAGGRAIDWFNRTGLLGKTVAGVGAGATGAGVQHFAEGEGPSRTEGIFTSALIGGGLGGAAPGAGRAVGAGWGVLRNAIANQGIDAKATNVILERLRGSGMTPAQAAQRLDELGPEAMLADVNPSMQVATGGTSIASTDAANIIGSRLARRREGGHGRVRREMEGMFGPPQDPYTVRQQSQAASRQAGGQFEGAAQYAVDTAPAADYIQSQLLRAPRGNQQAFWQELRALVTDEQGNLVSRGDLVHGAREALDRMRDQAARDGDGYALRELGEVRGRLRNALHQGIPGFAEWDAQYADIMARRGAYEQGRTRVLQGGPNTMTPAEILHLQRTSPAAVNEARLQGTLSEVDRQLYNERFNPEVTVDRTFSRDYNMDKMRIMAGQQRADQMRGMTEREGEFVRTSNLGEPGRGSRTATIGQAAQEMFGRVPGGLLGETLQEAGRHAVTGFLAGGPGGAAAGAGYGALQPISRRIQASNLPNRTQEIIRTVADRLTTTGAARANLITQLTNAAVQVGHRAQSIEGISTLAQMILTRAAGPAGAAAGRWWEQQQQPKGLISQ